MQPAYPFASKSLSIMVLQLGNSLARMSLLVFAAIWLLFLMVHVNTDLMSRSCQRFEFVRNFRHFHTPDIVFHIPLERFDYYKSLLNDCGVFKNNQVHLVRTLPFLPLYKQNFSNQASSETTGSQKYPTCVETLDAFNSSFSSSWRHLTIILSDAFSSPTSPASASQDFYPQFNDSMQIDEFSAPNIDSQVYILWSREMQNVSSLWEVYKINHKVVIRRVFESSSYYFLSNTLQRRKDFYQDTITCSVEVKKFGDVVAPLVKTADGHYDFAIQLAQSSHVFLDLTYIFNSQYHILTSGYFGIRDGSIEGADVLEQLNSGQSQIYIMQPSMISQRAEYLHYLHPITTQGSVRALFRQPRIADTRNIFFTPFRLHVWLAALAALSTIIGTIFLISLRCRWLTLTDIQFANESRMWILGAVVQQGWNEPPSSLTLRVIFFVALTTASLLYMCYSAKILAVFSNPMPPISSISALMKSNLRLKADGGSAMGFFQQDILKRYKKKISPEPDAFKAAADVWSRKYAFIGFIQPELLQLPNVSSTEKCEQISILPFSRVSYKNGMMVAKNSTLRGFFNYGLTKIIESGLNHRYFSSYRLRQCSKQRTPYVPESLSIRETYVAYAILSAGSILSVVFITAEKYTKIRQVRKTVAPPSGVYKRFAWN